MTANRLRKVWQDRGLYLNSVAEAKDWPGVDFRNPKAAA
jgi:hypothetical protein